MFAWLTPARRKAIYGIVAAGVAALMAFNVITADQLTNATNSVLSVLGALTALMAFLNTGTDSGTTDMPNDY